MEGPGGGRLPCPLLLQDEFPVREDLSDVTDEDAGPAQPPPPRQPPVPSFRVKSDADLFGLGLEETGRKTSSSEGIGGLHILSSPPSSWVLGDLGRPSPGSCF